ncbi:MAG: hypothetical protein AB1551_06505 [Actinomycetota bacterium]
MRLPLVVAALAVAALALPACDGGSGDGGATNSFSLSPISSTDATPTPVPPPSPLASPPPTQGPATGSCVHGWVMPEVGSPQYTEPLGIIRRTTGVEGPLVATDMRYFTGPEAPPSKQGYLQEIERWYIRLYAENDPAFQGRFLVEARWFGRGVAAVAPYRTHGFRSPDWVGFQYDGGDTTARTYPGLPGQWEGQPYDFVSGGGGLEFPGLPPDVVGCLDGS